MCSRTLCLSNITTCDHISQAFPLCICVLQSLEVGTARSEGILSETSIWNAGTASQRMRRFVQPSFDDERGSVKMKLVKNG